MKSLFLQKLKGLVKKRAACDRKMNLDKKKKSFGEIEWKKKTLRRRLSWSNY